MNITYQEHGMDRSEAGVRNILVVDDELMNIKMTERILKDMPSLRVIGAMNGEEALKSLEDNDIALIMLDLKMPGTDGFTLYGMIREKYGMPVVIMTADTESGTMQKIKELGIGGCLSKPLSRSAVLDVLSGLIGQL